MSYFERLKQLRSQKKLTKRDMARYFQVAESTYGKWELGQRKPDLKTLTSLADFFNVSVDYLLGITDDPTQSEKDISLFEAEESLKRFVENKLGREPNTEELAIIEAAANGLIERLKKKTK